MNAESFRDPRKNYKAWIAATALYPTNVGKIDLCLERQFLLRQPLLGTKATDVLADEDAPILHCRMGPRRAYSL
jgi:hypothetical protein